MDDELVKECLGNGGEEGFRVFWYVSSPLRPELIYYALCMRLEFLLYELDGYSYSSRVTEPSAMSQHAVSGQGEGYGSQ